MVAQLLRLDIDSWPLSHSPTSPKLLNRRNPPLLHPHLVYIRYMHLGEFLVARATS